MVVPCRLSGMIKLLIRFCLGGGRTVLQYGLCLLVVLAGVTNSADISQPYLIGRGISDITGPSYGVQMWGFGREDQLTEGLHIRQRSRAFVIAQADEPANRLVFVSADLGSIEHHITLAVIDQLELRIW